MVNLGVDPSCQCWNSNLRATKDNRRAIIFITGKVPFCWVDINDIIPSLSLPFGNIIPVTGTLYFPFLLIMTSFHFSFLLTKLSLYLPFLAILPLHFPFLSALSPHFPFLFILFSRSHPQVAIQRWSTQRSFVCSGMNSIKLSSLPLKS